RPELHGRLHPDDGAGPGERAREPDYRAAQPRLAIESGEDLRAAAADSGAPEPAEAPGGGRWTVDGGRGKTGFSVHRPPSTVHPFWSTVHRASGSWHRRLQSSAPRRADPDPQGGR